VSAALLRLNCCFFYSLVLYVLLITQPTRVLEQHLDPPPQRCRVVTYTYRNQEKKKKKKKARKETYSGKLGVYPDHPRWCSDMWSCMPGGLWHVVISFKFRQNRLNGFRDVGVEICHFLYLRPVAYITACTTVQGYKPWQNSLKFANFPPNVQYIL